MKHLWVENVSVICSIIFLRLLLKSPVWLSSISFNDPVYIRRLNVFVLCLRIDISCLKVRQNSRESLDDVYFCFL